MLTAEGQNQGLTTDEIYRLIRERIAPRFPEFARCASTRALEAHPIYQSLEKEISTVLETPEIGNFSRGDAPLRSSYRFLAWNVERGIELDGQIEAFRSHPYLRTCDVLLLTETDLGMARSGNRAVAQEMARALGMHYAFVPCYL
ncbi:MAG: hypothetical protein ACREH9_14060, partial [Pseudomonadota bacterium]